MSRFCRTKRVLATIMWVAVSAYPAFAQTIIKRPARALPMWTSSLTVCGFRPRVRIGNRTGVVSAELAFDHKGNLWTGFVEITPVLIPHETAVAGSSYYIAEIPAGSTQCIIRHKVPTTASSPTGLFFSRNNRMSIVANDQLQLLNGEDLSHIADVSLLRTSDHAYYRVFQSPEHTSLIVVAEGRGKPKTDVTWIDPASLNSVQSCSFGSLPDRQIFARSFADDGRYLELLSGFGVAGHWILGGRYCSAESVVLTPQIQPANAIILADQTVYFPFTNGNASAPESIVVYNSAGNLVHSIARRKREDVDYQTAIASETGTRVAVIVDTAEGGVGWLDISSHVASSRVDVYDTATWQRVGQIGLPLHKSVALAFSPDAGKLAIKTDDVIQVFDIP